jgi:hypothetical protein
LSAPTYDQEPDPPNSTDDEADQVLPALKLTDDERSSVVAIDDA